MLTKTEIEFILSQTKRSRIIIKRILLVLIIILYAISAYQNLTYMADIAIIGFALGSLFKTWNGDPVYKFIASGLHENELDKVE